MKGRKLLTVICMTVLVVVSLAVVIKETVGFPVDFLPDEILNTTSSETSGLSLPEGTEDPVEVIPQIIEDTRYAYACQIMESGNTRSVGTLSNFATSDQVLSLYEPEYPELSDSGAMLESWGDGAEFCRIKLWSGAPKQYEGTNESLVYLREEYTESEDGVAVTRSRFDRQVLPSLNLYMGYIIEDTDSGFVVRDRLGNKLFKTEEMPAVANTRDADGMPLFINSEGEYLYIKDGRFVASSYNDETDSRGLYFDYSTSFGISHSDIEKVSREGRDGVRYAYALDGEEITGYAYEKAFGFFEGYACAKNADGGYSVIDEGGNQRASSNKYYMNSDMRRVRMAYLDPSDPGIYSLGYYYFDDGLVRVRQVDTDFENGLVTLDRDLLIYPDGTEFELPGGFELVSYSEGILLLRSESTGLYGMFSNEGKWIAQPVFDYACPFVCGIAVLGFDGGYAGAIDKDGNVVIDFVYENISCPSGGSVLAYRADMGWTLLCIVQQ